MEALTVLNMYITANVLLLLAAVGVAAVRCISQRLQRPIAYRQQLQLAYALVLAAVVLPFTAVTELELEVFTPNAQVWSGASMHPAAGAVDEHQLAISVAASQVSVPLSAAGMAALVLLLGSAVPFLQQVRRVITASHRILAVGSVRVLACDQVHVPFSFWLPGSHCIVVPVDLMLRPADLRMAIRHEAQHHRQLDTKLVYACQLLRALFCLNPAVHWLQRAVAQLQEFACDEALVSHRKVSVTDYCSCLLRVAESAVASPRALLQAGMLGSSSGSLLRCRIEALLNTGPRRSSVVALGALLLAAMTGVAIAASGTVQDRRISLEQANAMAEQAQAGSDFPIVVNERVLVQLNQLLGTPDGRAYVRESLGRMQRYQPLIAQKTAQYGLPAELIAVPLAESGFRNLPRGKNPAHGAGIWMFIEPTARRFGLEVNGRVDQRLDVVAETDAAMRMFNGLNQSFADWGLALLAYNAGSRQVQRAIEATGSRDVWQLIEQGYENDADYVARVMAALLIIRNPQSLE